MTDVLTTTARRSAIEPHPASTVRGLVRATRPEQWIKNLLVFVAPAVAWSAPSSRVIVGGMIAFASFTLAAAGTYLLNDVTDRHADALHPVKCRRPIADGTVPPGLASVVGVGLVLAAGALPLLTDSRPLAACVGIYLVATVAYNAGVKQVAFVELAMVCAFYAVRAVGGALASGAELPVAVAVTLVATALTMIAGKRYAELRDQGGSSGTRRVLADYSLPSLRTIQAVAGATAVCVYGLWATARWQLTGSALLLLSIVPVAVGALRYAVVLAGGRGERPERLVWADRPLLASIVLAGVTFILGMQGIS